MQRRERGGGGGGSTLSLKSALRAPVVTLAGNIKCVYFHTKNFLFLLYGLHLSFPQDCSVVIFASVNCIQT